MPIGQVLKGLRNGAAVLLAGAALQAQAGIVTIDFDDLDPMTEVTDQYSDLGVTFSLATGGGPTVQSINGGIYAGVPDPTNTLVPGDDTADPFADITINFAFESTYFYVDVFDAEEPLTVSLYLGDDLAPEAAQSFTGGSNLQVYNIEFTDVLFDRVVLNVTEGVAGAVRGGPEYFDNIRFSVPEPTVLALFGIGLLVLALGRRSRV